MEWASKLVDGLLGGVPKAVLGVVPQHVRRHAADQLGELNWLKRISTNGDLTRAARLAWVEAAKEILAAAEVQAGSADWRGETGEIARFAAVARAEFDAVCKHAWNTNLNVGVSPIDRHLQAIIDGVPEFVAPHGPAPLGVPISRAFPAVLGELTRWNAAEVPAIFGQVAMAGLPVRGGGPARGFGELVFAAFAALLKDPTKYPEAGRAFDMLMDKLARDVSEETLRAVRMLDATIAARLGSLDALAALRDGLSQYLALLPAIAEGVTALVAGQGAIQATQVQHSADLQAILRQNENFAAEMAALTRHLLGAGTASPGPGAAAAVAQAVEATAEGAAAGDTRAARALELLKLGRVEEAVPLFEAEAAEREADSRRHAVEAARAWRNLGAIAGLRDPKRALEAYRKASDLDPSDRDSLFWTAWLLKDRGELGKADAALRLLLSRLGPDEARHEYWASLGRADIQVQRGDLAAAMTGYENAKSIARRLSEADPDNAGWQRDLSVSHDGIGAVLVSQGRLAEALAAFEAGMAIHRRLSEADPDNAGWQRDLSVSHNRIGDVLVSQGRLAEALAAFEADMAIAQRLSEADPGNAGWQRDLSVSHNKIGDVLVSQGRLAEALAAFEAGMAIHRRLSEADPDNAGWQRDLSVSHDRIGAVLVSQGRLAEALAAFEAGMAIHRRLSEADPDNAGWQRDLSVSHNRIGDVLVSQGRLAEALAAFEADMAIAQRLSEADPGNAGWQRDLSVSHNRIGAVLVSQGRLAEALAAFEAGMAIARRLSEVDPDNARWQHDLSVSHNKIGDVLVSQGRLAEALAAFEAGMAIRQRLSEADPDNAEWQRDLIVSHVKLSGLDPAGARRHLEQALAIAARLRDEGRLAPSDAWMPVDLEHRLSQLPP